MMTLFNRCAIASALAVTMFATACSTAWVSSAIAITNALLPVAVNVLQLVSSLQKSGTTSTTDIALAEKWSAEVSSDLNMVKTTLEQYNAAKAVDKPGILSSINDAIKITQTDLASFLPALHITNPQTQAKITAMVGLVSAEIGAIEGLISAAQGKTSITASTKKPLSAREFKQSYAAIVNAPTGDATVDEAAHKLGVK